MEEYAAFQGWDSILKYQKIINQRPCCSVSKRVWQNMAYLHG